MKVLKIINGIATAAFLTGAALVIFQQLGLDLLDWIRRKKRESFSRSSNQSKGQGLVEYAIILLLVALVMFILLVVFGRGVGNLYSNIISNV